MNLLQKMDLVGRGLDSSGPGQYCDVNQAQYHAVASIRTSYMRYDEVALEMFEDEGIPIRNTVIEAYRALFRRVLYFFCGRLVYDDNVICVVEIRRRHPWMPFDRPRVSRKYTLETVREE